MMQAWGQTLQALHEAMILRAGAVPTREEIAAWYEQLSPAGLWQDAVTTIYRVPYGLRLGSGLALAAFGALTIWRSLRRTRRPSQADVVRRVSQAAQAEAQPITADPSARASQAGAAAGAEGAPSGMLDHIEGNAPKAPPSPPVRTLGLRAFLMADQFAQGREPWAVPLGQSLVRIGRHQENDIRLEDKTVHRYHALLHRSPEGEFLIRDLSGETGNGVYVNGARIEQAALQPGDLVELGAVRLRFQQQRPS